MDLRGRCADIPTFDLARCRLRKLREGDAAALHRYYSDPRVYRHLDWQGPGSEEDARSAIARWNQGFAEGWIVRFGIADRATDELVGTVFLNGFEGRRAEVGYELAADRWRRGIMSEALRAVLDFGFGPLGRTRIQATVAPGNAASAALLEKHGFVCEGLLRQYEEHFVTKEIKDMRLFALVRP